MGGCHAHNFGHIKRCAASETNYAVGLVRLECIRAVHHLAAGGVAKDTREHRHIEAAEMRQKFGQHWQGGQRPVSDDQGAFATCINQVLCN